MEGQRNFSLADMIPEPLTFTDDRYGGSGDKYEVKTRDMFGMTDLVTVERLTGALTTALKPQQGATEAAATEAEAKEIERVSGLIFALLIPGLPAERIEKIPFMLQYRFIMWWHAQHQKDAAEGEAAAGQA